MKSYALWLAAVCALCGCTSAKTTNTPRTATEQLLISNAVDQALSKVDFQPFAGRKVFVEEKYIDSVDKNYVVGSVRHKLLMQGASITEKKEDSEITVELRAGGVGTNTNEMFVGIPEVTVPGMLTLPEVRLLTRQSQEGAAKIGMVAYETSTGSVLGQGGVSLAESDRNDWFVFGIGPYQNGSLKSEVSASKTQYGMAPTVEVPRYVAFETPGYRPGDDAARIRLTNDQQVRP